MNMHMHFSLQVFVILGSTDDVYLKREQNKNRCVLCNRLGTMADLAIIVRSSYNSHF